MHIIDSIKEMQLLSSNWRKQGQTIALVPTMGALHEGHLALMKNGRERANKVVVSIYVNPTQFGPNEDLQQYPRDIEGDLKKIRTIGADAVFTPCNETMYPPGFSTKLKVTSLTDNLCGASRSTHFEGVAIIVAKLFNIVQPNMAIFGLKDYQQFRVISRLVEDLNLPIEIIGHPTFRESDGLAMSSRNLMLSQTNRQAALCLSKGLTLSKQAFKAGERRSELLIKIARDNIEATPEARIDYLDLVDPISLKLAGPETGDKALMATAVFFGKTRLIDNIRLDSGQLNKQK